MPKQEDPIREALNEIAQAARQPSPLEVLGITRELATELQPEALIVAVRGLYRAFQIQLHPDKAGSSSAQSDRLQRIQQSYDSITPDTISGIRQSIVSTKKPGARLSRATREAAGQNQVPSETDRLIERSQTKSSEYIDDLMSPESISRVKRGFVLLRPTSMVKQNKNLPLQSLVIDGGLAFITTIDNPQTIDVPAGLKLPADKLKLDCYVENGQLAYIDDSGEVFLQETNLGNGWHSVRGIGEQRTLQSFLQTKPTEQFKLDLAGCLEEDSVNQLLRKFYTSSEWNQNQLLALNSSAENKSVPLRFQDRFVISRGWQDYTGGGAEVPGQLRPLLIPDQVLMARTGDNLLALGKIENVTATYMPS